MVGMKVCIQPIEEIIVFHDIYYPTFFIFMNKPSAVTAPTDCIFAII